MITYNVWVLLGKKYNKSYKILFDDNGVAKVPVFKSRKSARDKKTSCNRVVKMDMVIYD